MSAKTRRTLESMARSIEENTARINKKLSKAGVNANQALVFSAAKYYNALNRLAKE
jgi:hypothetical protein